MIKLYQVLYVSIVFFLGVSLLSCYERETACLDTFATDFAITADDPCDNCCTYPPFKFQIFHRIGEDDFRTDSIMTDAIGQNIRINRALFFISDISLHTENGKVLEVEETSLYETVDGKEIEQKEDIVLIQNSIGFVTVGTIRDIGVIDSISYTTGVSSTAIALEEESVLFKYDSLYVEGYFDIVLYANVGELLDQDISVKIRFENGVFHNGNSFASVNKVIRQEVGLSLTVDYEKIVKLIELDLSADEQILSNIQIPEGFITIGL